jgi:hypothetical protein
MELRGCIWVLEDTGLKEILASTDKGRSGYFNMGGLTLGVASRRAYCGRIELAWKDIVEPIL